MKTIILLVAVAFAACNSNNNNANLERVLASTPTPARAAQQQPNDGVRRITTAELENLMNQGKVVVVDVRNQQAYDIAHIRGAKLIPVPQVGERTKELPRDKMIVTYCA